MGHRAVVLTTQRNTAVPKDTDLDYPLPKCYQFKYDSVPGSVPDPNGCRVFQRSFSKLKTLKQCIVGKLHGSPMWRAYRQVVRQIRAGRSDGSSYASSPAALTVDDLTKLRDHMRRTKQEKHYFEFLDDFQKCAESSNCVLLDAVRRADEMIKYLSFKDWSSVDKPLKQWVADKVQYSASVYHEAAPIGIPLKRWVEGFIWKPKVTRNQDLEPEVIDGIVRDCFGVSGDSYGELPDHVQHLERSLVCNPLMMDSLEVPGAPEPPLVDASTMWDKTLGAQGMIKWDLQNTPPVCGRAAAMLAGWPQIHASNGYAVRRCMTEESRRWSKCAVSEHFNCICFEQCWRAALRRVCELTAGECCGDFDQLEYPTGDTTEVSNEMLLD